MAGLQSTRPIMDLWYLIYYNLEVTVEIPFYPNSLKQKNNSSLQLHRLPLRKLKDRKKITLTTILLMKIAYTYLFANFPGIPFN